MTKTSKKYDGFYFSPHDDDELEHEALKISFFELVDSEFSNEPEEKYLLGHKFLLAFFKFDEDDVPVLDETNEAILSDPEVYVNNLIGSGLFGCIVKKTPRGVAWFKDYLKTADEVVQKYKMEKKLLQDK